MLSNTKLLYCIVIFLLLLGCSVNEESVPLPKSYLRIDFPQKSFHSLNSKCPFSFEIPDYCFSAEKFTKFTPKLNFPRFQSELLCSTKIHLYLIEEQIRSNVGRNFRARIIENTWLNPKKTSMFEITKRCVCYTQITIFSRTSFMAKPNYDSLQPVIRHRV